MRAVAVALVLIAGAAVVLWFGNMLNSWVLGGLIGGFAALLLSIPISLTLFSYLARRHDERSYMEAQEEFSFMQARKHLDVPPRTLSSAYEIESYVLPTDDEWFDDEDDHQRYTTRDMPASPSRRLPAAGQGRASQKLLPPQRDMPYSPSRSSRELSAWQSSETPERRPASRRSSTGELRSNRGRLQSEALRVARQEVTQQYNDDEIEELPTHYSRHLSSHRPGRSRSGSQPLSSAYEQPSSRRPSRPLSQRPRRTGSERSYDDFYHQHFYEEDESTDDEFFGPTEAQTDYLDQHYPRTEPIDPPRRSGQFPRHSRLNDRRQESKNITSTGDLRRPRVRKAPYMYEDDPLRQELSQHLNTPMVRRSSRLDSRRQHNEEDWL